MIIEPRPDYGNYPLNGTLSNRSQTKRIMLHCTATPEGREVTFSELYDWHVRNNGWTDVGYHYLIRLDGTVQECREPSAQGAGCSGQNHDTIHISYAGGLASDGVTAKDTRTPEQLESMVALIRWLADSGEWPDLNHKDDIVGHNEFAAKACPSFNVAGWVEEVIREGESGNPEPGDPEIPLYEMVNVIRQLNARIDDLERINAEQASLLDEGRKG